MRVLITVAAGFIGSNLAKRCVELGWDVTGVDDMSNGHPEFVPAGVKLLSTDFASNFVLQSVCRQAYDVIIHLAALPRVSYSVERPLMTHEVNVTKTLSLMDEAKGNVDRFVFASSSSVYGNVNEACLPVHENYDGRPRSPYALQKRIIEDYLLLYNDLYDLESVALRFFNVFGPNQLGSSPYACAVSSWLTAIKSGKPMRSDGTGEQSRDLCYVDNVVDACVRAAQHDDHPFDARCYNIACGDSTSNNEIIAYLMHRYPNATKIDAAPRPGDVKHTLADISRASDDFGYTPIVKAWAGIERTCAWYDDNWSWIKDLKQRV